MDFRTFAIRLAVALILGAVIGFERQWHQRMAGTRTNGLVAAAAAAFSMIGLMDTGMGNVSRIVGQIVSGVGFLGAGVIFKEGMNVHGLNTAATVWCAAAVGSLSGFGYPEYALMMTLAVVLTNVALRPLAYKLHPDVKEMATNYHLEVTCAADDEMKVRGILLNAIGLNHTTLTALASEDVGSGKQVRVAAAIKSPTRNDAALEEIVSRVSLDPAVTAVSWKAETPIAE